MKHCWAWRTNAAVEIWHDWRMRSIHSSKVYRVTWNLWSRISCPTFHQMTMNPATFSKLNWKLLSAVCWWRACSSRQDRMGSRIGYNEIWLASLPNQYLGFSMPQSLKARFRLRGNWRPWYRFPKCSRRNQLKTIWGQFPSRQQHWPSSWNGLSDNKYCLWFCRNWTHDNLAPSRDGLRPLPCRISLIGGIIMHSHSYKYSSKLQLYSIHAQLMFDWYLMYYPELMKARVSPVQSIEPHRILAPTRDLNQGPPGPLSRVVQSSSHYTTAEPYLTSMKPSCTDCIK